ncbi:MAG: TRAP transporter substrate-binding protein [Deltaproteobacteria bacterium]|nr:TRAP transporter substrate-binding protein [Deltaproteobacteria bacterium]
MQKNKMSVFLAVLFLVFSLTCFINPSSAQKIELSLSHFYPAVSFQDNKMHAQWIAEIEKATNGKVKITVFPGATLLKPAETYDGIVSGTADIGNGVYAYTRGRFPLMEGFELPGINFGSCAATTMVAVQGVEKFKPKEISDTKMMYLYSVGPGSLYSKKEVKNLNDMKGMRIRATGLTAKSIEALGAIPVAMPMNDAYESLSKGVIDGNIGPPEILITWKQAEVTKFITIIPPVYNSIQYTVMNLGKWNGLPADIQKAFQKVNDAFNFKAAQIWDGEMSAGMNYGLGQGMKMIHMPDADNEKAMALMQPLIDDYISRMEAKGLPGKEVVDFVKEKAAIYSKLFSPGY